ALRWRPLSAMYQKWYIRATVSVRTAMARVPGRQSDESKQRLVVQSEICDQTFQPGILMLELPQPAGLVDLEATVLGLPAVERLLGEAVPPAELGGLPARLGLFQDSDDLLFREPLPAHRGVLPAGLSAGRVWDRLDGVILRGRA